MRVTKFMKEHGISFETMVKISQYLKWNDLKPNMKLNDEEVEVFLRVNFCEDFNSRIKEFKGAEPIKRPKKTEELMKFEGCNDDLMESDIIEDEKDSHSVEDYEDRVMNSFHNGTSDLYGF